MNEKNKNENKILNDVQDSLGEDYIFSPKKAVSHPLHDFSEHTHYEDFENFTNLDKKETKVVLRVLKHFFERHIKMRVPDDLFIELVKVFPHLAPKHPLGSPFTHLGYKIPIEEILHKYGYEGIDYKTISSFFKVGYTHNEKYENILLHIPHSSTRFPEESNHSFADLDAEERLLIDYYTDELFVPERASKHIVPMVFPYCRLYCDVERLAKDPLESKGLGISYHRIDDQTVRIFSNLLSAFRLYADFHAEVSMALVGLLKPLIIDCHSFSNVPNLLNSQVTDIDICIGYNEDETRPDDVLIGTLIHHFKTCGYKVGLNAPFSNSKTFAVPTDYHSVMIEVNKRIYMNEQTLEKTEGFQKLKEAIDSIFPILISNPF